MRVVVVSDIHGNLTALDAVLAHAGSLDGVWCLGDVVGYGPEPNECVERLRDLGALAIAGNHDWAALGRLSIDEFSADAAAAARWTADQLNPAARAWLAERPETLVVGDATLAHGSPRYPIWEYVIGAHVAAASFEWFDTPLCLIGHTHVPCSFQVTVEGRLFAEYRRAGDVLEFRGTRLLANPGSVGQPRDEDPRTAYLIYDSDAASLHWRRCSYTVAVTQDKVRQAGLPLRLATRLAVGR